jgi:hypothetical protein
MTCSRCRLESKRLARPAANGFKRILLRHRLGAKLETSPPKP